jgi:hypothetical protein
VKALGGFMKLFLAIVLGIVASFGLTILSEFVWFNSSTNKVWHLYPEFFGVAVIVGALVGLIARKQAKVAAALSLAPWCVWLVVGAKRRPNLLAWAITIVLVSLYLALGVGSAHSVSKLFSNSGARNK